MSAESDRACLSCGSVAGYADGPPCLTCHYATSSGPEDGGVWSALHSDDAVTIVARELIHPAERYNPASIDVARPIAEAVLRALRSHLTDLVLAAAELRVADARAEERERIAAAIEAMRLLGGNPNGSDDLTVHEVRTEAARIARTAADTEQAGR